MSLVNSVHVVALLQKYIACSVMNKEGSHSQGKKVRKNLSFSRSWKISEFHFLALDTWEVNKKLGTFVVKFPDFVQFWGFLDQKWNIVWIVWKSQWHNGCQQQLWKNLETTAGKKIIVLWSEKKNCFRSGKSLFVWELWCLICLNQHHNTIMALHCHLYMH